MKNKGIVIAISAAAVSVCAIGAYLLKRYVDHKNRFIPAAELQKR